MKMQQKDRRGVRHINVSGRKHNEYFFEWTWSNSYPL